MTAQKLRVIRASLGVSDLFCTYFYWIYIAILELSVWAVDHNLNFFDQHFIQTTLNTVLLAFVSALICTGVCLLVSFSARLQKNRYSKQVSFSFLRLCATRFNSCSGNYQIIYCA